MVKKLLGGDKALETDEVGTPEAVASPPQIAIPTEPCVDSTQGLSPTLSEPCVDSPQGLTSTPPAPCVDSTQGPPVGSEIAGRVVHVLSVEDAKVLLDHHTHPLAAEFPLDEASIAKMMESIDAVGQLEPVILLTEISTDDDGKEHEVKSLLNGRRRASACIALGRPLHAVFYEESDLGMNVVEWVLGRNRGATECRVLSDTQWAILGARLAARESEAAAERMTSGKAAAESEKGRTSERLARAAGVTDYAMRQALKITPYPDLAERVYAGLLELCKAAEIAEIEDDETRHYKIKEILSPPTPPPGRNVLPKPVLPTKVKRVFSLAAKTEREIDRCVESLSRLIKTIDKRPSFLSDAKKKAVRWRTELLTMLPKRVCVCDGLGCNTCHNSGWLTADEAKELGLERKLDVQ